MAVLRPASTEEVSEAVKICAEHGVAIVPQGGNTNVCGMTLASRDAVILNLSRMNQIIEVDREGGTITVEAGATMQAVQEAATEAGLLFAPDWGARGSAQVGGAVATNGGGLNVIGYGTTREQVMGLEAVLADGRIWNGMRHHIKDNSGYDLKQLLIGSEGTLGIITRLVFRLHPAPSHRISMMAVLTSTDRLMDALALARQTAGDQLVAFELMNGLGVELALERYPDLKRPFETRADWYVLIQLAGGPTVTEAMEQIFSDGFEQEIFSDGVLANSIAQERNLWEIREQLIPIQYFDCPFAKWDVSVPVSRIMEYLHRARDIASDVDPELVCYAVGHVGDGNIHYNIFLQGRSEAEAERIIPELIRRIDDLIAEMGGSITAEHGVGTAYIERVRRLKSGVEYELMLKLRELFDPNGILNPGKLLPRKG
ncbi:FAD-binding oxidoreductase [Roseicyclus sp. F158]|uniref:FAD-binding oxidoreductase n=1 Tax=Tropicimonas omnivorans TaxID=3075590 RepID=A0ABU3DEP8_9RHOB|nr:FAD-binding oxidoreductase [Roseicyclus sp. F158]MDT0682034.1 FAD-binding oxidoreductase [Roseicyclus sp. F158]